MTLGQENFPDYPSLFAPLLTRGVQAMSLGMPVVQLEIFS